MAKGVELTLNDGNGNELIIKPGEALEAAEAEEVLNNQGLFYDGGSGEFSDADLNVFFYGDDLELYHP